MRAKTILMGAALGAAAYYMKQHPETRAQLKAQGQDLGRKLRDRVGPLREQVQEKTDQVRQQLKARSGKGHEAHLHGAHKSTTDQNHEDLEHLVDDVVHRPDIPDTEMKHAFEEAVEEHHRI